MMVPSDQFARRRIVLLLAAVATVVITSGMIGCAGPGPRLLLSEPLRVERVRDGGELRWYDTNRDNKEDYAEQLGTDGRISQLKYLDDGGGEQNVFLNAIPESERRNLVIILDSVPYPMVRDAWERGALRFAPRPSRTIAPFPAMTDPCLADFFHMSPGIAIESDYYDGHRETSPYGIYLDADIAIWHRKIDYWLPHSSHASTYLDPLPWFDHELRAIQDGFNRSDKKTYIGYCVGTSALGATQGWNGHAKGLSRIDRFCREMVYRTRGRVRITLLSDHGHSDLDASQRIPLASLMRAFGYRVGDKLKSPNDLIVPEFAMVSCAAMYTHAPASPARDAVKIEGVDLAAYLDKDDNIVVIGRGDKQARLSHSSQGYKYEPLTGDPLALQPILAKLKAEGQTSSDGFVADDVLFDATRDHVYPDVVDRLWRAFHEQFQHSPNVLLSIMEGYHCGSAFQTRAIGKFRGVHGSLLPISSSGFAITAAGDLPPVMRLRDLSTNLHKLGVDVLR